MSEIRYTKNGLLIPPDRLKGLGEDVRVQQGDGFLIIESKQRKAVRGRLSRMVKKLREAGSKLSPISQDEIDALVEDVRKVRAGHC